MHMLTAAERDIAETMIYAIHEHIADYQGSGMPKDWLLHDAGSYSGDPLEDKAYRDFEMTVFQKLVELGYITVHGERCGLGDNIRVRIAIDFDVT